MPVPKDVISTAEAVRLAHTIETCCQEMPCAKVSAGINVRNA
jgi:hypothetical protein